MTTPNYPDPTDAESTELEGEALLDVGPAGYPDPQLVTDAIAHAEAATRPRLIGHHTQLLMAPVGYELHLFDERDHEDVPRYREGRQTFSTVSSLAQYVARYRGDDSLAYAVEPTDPVALLRAQGQAVAVVLDDHPLGEFTSGGRRTHRAVLATIPSPAASRWGDALAAPWLDQETLLDLVTDGAGEIVEPDAALLRDLVSTLHAVRTAEVTSVIRTGGEAEVRLAEQIKLKSGPIASFTFPETLTVTFQPFVRCPHMVQFPVAVKARVADKHVKFSLRAPWLAEQLRDVVDMLAYEVAADTGLTPMWRPTAE